MSANLTDRWTPLKPHPEQIRLLRSPARFKVVPAGRRSGKTERAKRKLVTSCLDVKRHDARYFASAPTYQQAKAIFWDDLLALTPKWSMRDFSISELTIKYVTGAELVVFGMDKPQRMEGRPWDGGVLDEYANMKPEAWGANVRPALADRKGWAWLIGVPEGRNHYYDMHKRALADETGEWASFSWKSADILPPEEIESARKDLDPLTFQQEYEASFLNFEGRAYYPFEEVTHCEKLRAQYAPRAPLIVCFDFNVDPGVCAVIQELRLPERVALIPAPVIVDGRNLFGEPKPILGTGTAIIGEVYIPRNSNTPAVCKKLIHDFGAHEGHVYVYGDATGGARKTSQTQGSDWDLVKTALYAHFGSERVHFRVPDANPSERARINATNTRLRAGDGTVRMMVDPAHAPNCVRDFEGVKLLKGGSGEIDKKHSPELTHLTDAVGYYIEAAFPVRKRAGLLITGMTS